MGKVHDEIIGGNGNQFTVKEILQEHIRTSDGFRKEVRGDLDTIRTRIEEISIVKTETKFQWASIGLLFSGFLFILKKVLTGKWF